MPFAWPATATARLRPNEEGRQHERNEGREIDRAHIAS